MAASSSDESLIAPRDFQLSSSLDSGSRLSPTKHKCPLCHKVRKIFYCKECVHSGEFYRTTSQIPEGYAEKQREYLELIANKEELENACMQLLENRLKADVLNAKIRYGRERNRVLKLSVEEKQKKKILLSKDLATVSNYNERRAKFQAKCDKKVQEVEQYVENEQDKLTRHRRNLVEKKKLVKKIVKLRLEQLVKYVFPITKVYPKGEFEKFGDTENDAMVAALSEASQSSDLRSSWEYAENCSQVCYSIAGPTLPASGVYTCYNMWLAQNRDGSNIPGSCSTTDHRDHAYNISAALTYTTELVQLIAYYLDVVLPFKVFYSDFCHRDLTEQQFNMKVARLNANILFLCYTQNIDLDCLRPCETIHNILQLLNFDNQNMGNDEPVELDAGKVEKLEKAIVTDLQKYDDSDSDEGFMPSGWENIRREHIPEISAGSMVTSQMNTQQASSMAGGLVNSAAASIASIWKGFTGR